MIKEENANLLISDRSVRSKPSPRHVYTRGNVGRRPDSSRGAELELTTKFCYVRWAGRERKRLLCVVIMPVRGVEEIEKNLRYFGRDLPNSVPLELSGLLPPFPLV